jgi:hypothetical protein
MTYRTFLPAFAGLALGAVVLFAGCSSEAPQRPQASAPSRHDESEHAHAEGVKALGDYHARILVDEDAVLRLVILSGKDENKINRIDRQDVIAYVQVANQPHGAKKLTLKPEPQPGDPEGKTSQFAAALPEEFRGRPLVVTLRLNIGGEVYSPEFSSVPGSGGHGGHGGMPKPVASDKERELFLTPGGIYTAADIKANGGLTPSQKFAHIDGWPHDDDLKPGDKVCPVTKNKADPRCDWIVNGQRYEFCCPPCLQKFVGWAKTAPEKVKEPSAYVYKE